MIRRIARITGKTAVTAWFVVMLSGSAILLGRHAIALPKPAANDPVLVQALTRLKTPAGESDPSTALVVHVLYAKCACSKNIAAHLATSARPTNLSEVVIIAGDGEDRADFETLLIGKFRIVHASTTELHAAYHIDAAPLLVVIGADGVVDYSGGYTTEKQGAEIHDLDIIARARRAPLLDSLPIFGCAVSEGLRKQLDPTTIF